MPSSKHRGDAYLALLQDDIHRLLQAGERSDNIEIVMSPADWQDIRESLDTNSGVYQRPGEGGSYTLFGKNVHINRARGKDTRPIARKIAYRPQFPLLDPLSYTFGPTIEQCSIILRGGPNNRNGEQMVIPGPESELPKEVSKRWRNDNGQFVELIYKQFGQIGSNQYKYDFFDIKVPELDRERKAHATTVELKNRAHADSQYWQGRATKAEKKLARVREAAKG